MRFPARIPAAVTAILAGLALVAGCGGGDSAPADDATAGLAPSEILERSSDAYRELTGLRVAFEITGAADLGPQVTGLLGETIDISGEALVRPPDRLAMDATVAVAGLPLQGSLTRVRDEVVLGALGRNIALDIDPATLDYLDFGAAYPELTGWITDPTAGPGGDVGGTTTVAISGPLDPERVIAAIAPLLDGAEPATVRPGAISATATISVGVEDLLPRRVVIEVTGDAGEVAPAAGAIDLTLAADASDFGTTDQVTLPQADERLTPDRLGSLLGR